MANIKSAKKRIRVIDKKTARNNRIRNHVKQAEKAFLNAIEAGNVAEAEKAFKVVEKKLMQASAKGPFHKNTASRLIGRYENKLNIIKNGGKVQIVKEQPKKKAKKVVEPEVEAPVVEAEVKEEAPAKEEKPAKKAEKPAVDASMKKDELLAVAKKLKIEVPAKATKADIIALIEGK